MSIRVMNSVWESAPYTEGTLLVLLALADWANEDGICWPKVETIAQKSRLSERAAQNCLKRLTDDGAISIIEKSSGPGRPHKYQLGVQFLHPSKEKGVQLTTKRGAVDDKKGCSSRQCNKEEPSVEPPTNQEATLFAEANEAVGEPVREDVNEALLKRAWAYFIETLEKHPKLYTLTEKRRKMGLARIAECLKITGGDPDKVWILLETAIDGLAGDDFHNARGQYKGKTAYTDWEHVFRSTEQIQRWWDRS